MALRRRDWGWLALMAVVVIWGGQVFNHVEATAQDAYGSIAQAADDRYEVERAIMRYYVEEVDPAKLQLAEIDGMMNELDTFSDFLNEQEQEELRTTTEGAFGGLGIEIYVVSHYPTVMAPLEETPAWEVGLQPGDQIIKIEGESTRDVNLDVVVSKLRGVPGTAVNITIARPGVSEPMDFHIVRAIIQIHSVTFAGMVWDPRAPNLLLAATPDWVRSGEHVGYLRLRAFSRGATDETRAALDDLRAGGARGIILDLRSNPGGLLEEARGVADLFLPKGQLIVWTKGRVRSSEQRLFSQRDPEIPPTTPLVVLVDEGSASASEIVAGAIQDNDRGLVIGRSTYGKGSVQTVYNAEFGARYGLDFSEHAVLKLTTAYYYSPSGRAIHKPRWREGARGAVVSKAAGDTATEYRTTVRGRVVHGGGGISVDVQVPPDVPPPLYWQLRSQRVPFNFAIDYVVKHPNPNARTFTITDDILAGFERFVADSAHEFKYEPQGLRELDELQKSLRVAQSDSSVFSEVNRLKTMLQNQEASQFARTRPYMSARLLSEIGGRVWGRNARVRAEFVRDWGLKEALTYLNNETRYVNQLALSPSAPPERDDEPPDAMFDMSR